ncbi:MAG: hypothetical protein IPP33_01290 [Flavobacteriales bacterium]|nr:hypothetical protein [Flavobacteriales bacterium]
MRTQLLLISVFFLLGFDTSAQVFTQKADLPEPRYRAFSFAADGKLFTGCGRDESDAMNNAFWQYDPATNQWTQKADYPTAPARGGIAMVIDGIPYARSGWNGTATFTDWNRYDVMRGQLDLDERADRRSRRVRGGLQPERLGLCGLRKRCRGRAQRTLVL